MIRLFNKKEINFLKSHGIKHIIYDSKDEPNIDLELDELYYKKNTKCCISKFNLNI